MTTAIYVIATVTGKEEYNKQLLESVTQNARFFIPYKIIPRRYEGAWHDEKSLLFPGYIFVETEQIEQFIGSLPKSFFQTYFQVLGRNEEKYLAVKEEEMALIRRLSGDEDLTVPVSHGIKEGKVITFTEGPLVGMEGFVRKVDRHKRKVTLEVEMFGRIQNFTVGAEIITGAKVSERKEI